VTRKLRFQLVKAVSSFGHHKCYADRGQRTEDRGQRTEDRLKISPSTLSTISALKLDNGWHSRSGPENQVADLMPEFGY
jgi:hypothetical protein